MHFSPLHQPPSPPSHLSLSSQKLIVPWPSRVRLLTFNIQCMPETLTSPGFFCRRNTVRLLKPVRFPKVPTNHLTKQGLSPCYCVHYLVKTWVVVVVLKMLCQERVISNEVGMFPEWNPQPYELVVLIYRQLLGVWLTVSSGKWHKVEGKPVGHLDTTVHGRHANIWYQLGIVTIAFVKQNETSNIIYLAAVTL